MKTFEITSWVLGTEQKIIVTEPPTLDSSEFKLKLYDLDEYLVVILKDGHWVSFLNRNISPPLRMIEQLEIDSIGFQIAKHWCNRLTQQLENFQISI
jgi:hypothetical protein